MDRTGYYRFLLVLWVCLSVSVAQADEKEIVSTKPYTLGEVVVSADVPGKNVITTLEISGVDIERRNAKTLDKALELLPGVDVSSGAKGIPRINIRGFRSRHTILLLNGIPINSTYDGQFDPHIISTESISKIKISYGNNSVLYGQGGLGGVINIITKQGTTGAHLETSGELDEQGNYYAKANVSGGNEKMDFFFSLHKDDSDGILLSDDFDSTSFESGSIRENSDDERVGFLGNFGFQIGTDVEMGLTLERSFGEYGTPSTIVDDKSDPFYEKPKYDRVDDFDTFSAQLSMSYEPGGLFGLRAWGFFNNQEQKRRQYNDETYTDIKKRENVETTSKGGNLQASLDFESPGQVVFSFSGQTDEFESHTDHTRWDLDLYSAALEYQFQLLSRLDVVMGYSHHWQNRDEGNDDDKGSYMVGTRLKVTDTTTIRASYAKKIRFPSIKQLYDNEDGEIADLKPEESDNYEAGITQKLFWGMDLDLSVFQYNVDEYIEKNDDGVSENNDEYEFKGFEARLTKQIMENGSIGFSYSLLKTEDKSSGTLKDELQYRPEHKYTIDANYTWDFGLTAHADFMRVTDQYHYSRKFLKGKLNDYSIVNLKLEQRLYRNNLSVYVGVDNLLDEDYEESYGYPRAGRTGYAGVRHKF